MFSERYFGKSRKHKKHQTASAEHASEPSTPTVADPVAAAPQSTGAQPTATHPPVVRDHEAEDGIALTIYAQRHAINEAEVWERVRRGELVARTESGRVYIYNSDDTAELPPLRLGASAEYLPKPDATNEFLSLSGGRGQSPEFALLLDHLSLAKEENREILRLTQDSLRKVTELSDRIVAMKDAVIEAKDQQIAALREQLATHETHMRTLRQQNEDLEMLARAVAKAP